jgi:hypothetical protein
MGAGMPNRRSHGGHGQRAEQPESAVAFDASLVRYAAVLVAAPLRPLGNTVTCCFCGARVREAELVRPIWGPRPCPQGHLHAPLAVVTRCRSCAEAERHRLEEHARRLLRMQPSVQGLTGDESAAFRERRALSAPAGSRRRPPVAAQTSLFQLSESRP